jgi:hypothetical protein
MADFVNFFKNDIGSPLRDFGKDLGVMDLLKSTVGAGSSVMRAFGSLAGSIGQVGSGVGMTAQLVPILIGGVFVLGAGYYLLKGGKR